MAEVEREKKKELAYHPVVRAVALALKERCGVGEGERVVVGVSGGADSVALLLAMVFLSKRRGRGMEIAVGHVNHGLRESAEKDEAFVEALAFKLGLGVSFGKLDLSKAKGNMEAAARAGRYEMLGAMAVGSEATFVAVAHHADDQMETVLLNLTRGAGTKGLRGMAWKRRLLEDVWLLRPMLGVTKEEILDFLARQGQDYCTDETNADTTRARARLRADVLPALKAIHARAARNVGRSASQVAEAHRALGKQGKALFGDVDVVKRAVLRKAPAASVAVGIKRWLAGRGLDTDRLGSKVVGSMVKAIRDTEGGVRRFELSGGNALLVTRDCVEFKSG
jgi:tRNA(Ile)-lysidine synthase